MNWDWILQELPVLARHCLVHGTVLALLTWLLCATVLRRSRPALQAALWTVVLLKFLIPPVLPGELALSSWLARAGGAWLGALAESGSVSTTGAWLSVSAESAVAAQPGSATWPPNLSTLLLACWLGAVAWIACGFLVRAVRHRRQIASLPLLGGVAGREAHALAAGMGIRRGLRFRLGPAGQSPYVTGLRRPTIVLPPSALTLEEPARQALILHELAHVRRGDLWVRCLENAARVLFFFWPPVWWVCRRIERHSELACDQWALAVSRVRPDLYARSLLEIVKTIAASPLQRRQLAFAGKSANLEERFKMILDKKNVSPRLSWLMVPALALWTVFAVAGGPAPQSEGEKEPVKKRTRSIMIQGGPDEALPVEVLEKFPGADLNGDGTLTSGELRAHLGASGEGGANVFKFRTGGTGISPVESAEAMRRLLERFSEADLNGDGQLEPEELRAYLKEHGGDHHGFAFVHPGPGDRAVFISGEGPLADEDFDMVVGSRAELLQSHPEADADGDGRLSGSELKAWGKSKAAERGRFAVRIEGGDEADRQVEAYVWAAGDGEDLSWISSAGDHVNFTSDDGGEVVVKIRKEGAEGHEAHAIVVDRIESWVEDFSEDEDLSQGRAERLLKKYPEADLDGDGALSKEEAAALAARLAEERKRP